ncbi:hypothetical protein BHC48_02330 [Snodgrassella communis]|uniref:Uncharacterized protein n=1 Tax=Snodgrassella alvi TaxID=1196083 RepID=A0A2N9XSU0_9NEIS|nr:hypothetical protein BHC48_02330 [Snodgrassella communis]
MFPRKKNHFIPIGNKKNTCFITRIKKSSHDFTKISVGIIALAFYSKRKKQVRCLLVFFKRIKKIL